VGARDWGFWVVLLASTSALRIAAQTQAPPVELFFQAL
jgi:hypothetical protein